MFIHEQQLMNHIMGNIYQGMHSTPVNNAVPDNALITYELLVDQDKETKT